MQEVYDSAKLSAILAACMQGLGQYFITLGISPAHWLPPIAFTIAMFLAATVVKRTEGRVMRRLGAIFVTGVMIMMASSGMTKQTARVVNPAVNAVRDHMSTQVTADTNVHLATIIPLPKADDAPKPKPAPKPTKPTIIEW